MPKYGLYHFRLILMPLFEILQYVLTIFIWVPWTSKLFSIKILEYAPKLKCTIFGVTAKHSANGIGNNVQICVIWIQFKTMLIP